MILPLSHGEDRDDNQHTSLSHGYELVLNHESDDRYQVTIFDPKGNRIATTGTHLERQGALTEASRYVDHLSRATRAT